MVFSADKRKRMPFLTPSMQHQLSIDIYCSSPSICTATKLIFFYFYFTLLFFQKIMKMDLVLYNKWEYLFPQTTQDILSTES